MMRQQTSQWDRHGGAWTYRRLALLAVLAGAWLVPDTLPAQQQAWEFSPYKVQIWLATEAAGELSAGVQQNLVSGLSRRIEAMIGAPWRAEIVEPPAGLEATLLIDQGLVTAEVLDSVAPEAFDHDKIIFLTVRANPREFQIEAREMDCRTRQPGTSVRQTIRQPDLLEITCFDAVADAFRAVTRLEIGAPKSATVRIRAGGLVLDRTSPCFVGSEDVLLPIQRNNDRAGQAARVIPIDWTFLQVQTPDETNPYLMNCRVWSGKPNPVTGKNTPRKERYALKVTPAGETTTLRVSSRIVRRGDESHPMPGLEVYAKAPEPDPPTEDDAPAEPETPSESSTADAAEPAAEGAAEGEAAVAATEPEAPTETAAAASPSTPKVQGDPAELLGRTDWNGTLEIGQSETLLRIVYLKNGGQLLARLPMVPGLEQQLIAEVPDDASRLEAEGFIKGLQGQLMDLEAQREILKARFMLRHEEKKLDEAQKLLEEIKQLPTRNDLVAQLDRQQNQQVESPVKSVQARIDQLYAKMREALGKYLSPNLVNELTNVLNDARRNQPANATAALGQ